MCTFIVTGKVNGRSISELIQNVSPHAPEAFSTAERKIINQFKSMGYNEDDIIFDRSEIEQPKTI